MRIIMISPQASNILQICMSDHAPKIWKGKGGKPNQSVHVITASEDLIPQ